MTTPGAINTPPPDEPRPFWPEHTLRCIDCGRDMPLGEARTDGWKRLDDAPLPSKPTTLKGRCWRCDRDKRANETGGTA